MGDLSAMADDLLRNAAFAAVAILPEDGLPRRFFAIGAAIFGGVVAGSIAGTPSATIPASR